MRALPIFDMHMHTTASDGELTPGQLVSLAVEREIEYLSITDHDTVDAYDSFDDSVIRQIRLVPGIELSTSWRKIGVHVLGYGFDLGSPVLRQAVAAQQKARYQRAEQIDQRLVKAGFPGSLEWINARYPQRCPGRPDFAAFLCHTGVVQHMDQAFKDYLGPGKLGDVRQHWLSLEDVIDCIRQSGGVAVLAHPLKYQLTNRKLRQLLTDFCTLGGSGLEVVSGWQDAQKTAYLTQLSGEFELIATAGSDFHRCQTPWASLGRQTVTEATEHCVERIVSVSQLRW
ncbi:MAG: PHP domain-containing protein [Wenzhouxiangellaceae bacterium]